MAGEVVEFNVVGEVDDDRDFCEVGEVGEMDEVKESVG